MEITIGNNELVIETGSKQYKITVPVRNYHTEFTTNQSGLINEMKQQSLVKSLPVEVMLGGIHQNAKFNVVVLRMTNSEGITGLSGSFYEQWMRPE